MVQTKTQSPVPLQAYAVLAVGVIAVSLGSIFIRLAQQQGVPSLLIAAARLAIAAIILTPIALQRHRADLRQLQRNDWLLLGTAGLFLAIHFAAWVSSLEYTNVLVSTVLVNTNPLWVAILEVLFLKARLNRMVKLALLLGLVGGVIIGIPSKGPFSLANDQFQGALLALMGALAVAVYFTIGRKLRAKLPVLLYIWLVYSCGALILLLGVFTAHIPLTGYTNDAYLWLVTMAVFPQLIGHSSLNYALGFLQATYVTISAQLEPVVSAIFAYFLFQEIPGVLQFIGSLVVLSAVFLASWGQSGGTEHSDS